MDQKKHGKQYGFYTEKFEGNGTSKSAFQEDWSKLTLSN